MNKQVDGRQAGVVLMEVVLMLALFEIIGVVFATFSTAERQCEQNPTAVIRDGRCIRQVGTTQGRP